MSRRTGTRQGLGRPADSMSGGRAPQSLVSMRVTRAIMPTTG